ncbi:fluoride efflux transporter FluC [Streptomonospora litoralis]|uniref:Fluoride-specific ion channel FluC n=1 Tax=Streptomonospora litoralis TaxID=2498135 RepID=A0A4P6Q048_9ACTN|nr:CrcB family protein [Streptomonospora litoralis]QBI52044.1 camphor resistance protein CrcB [Streptomonospora litoralis]
MPESPECSEVPGPGETGAGSAAPAGAPDLVDPDDDLHVARRRRGLRGVPWAVLAAVSAGGAVGGAARRTVELLLPHEPSGFPWSTAVANVSGCLFTGVLMTVLVRARPDSRLLRPFVGVGILGGYTTFSAYAGDVQARLAGGEPAASLGYAGATLLCGLAAVWAGVALTEPLVKPGASAEGPRDRGLGGTDGGGSEQVRP